MSCQQSYPIKGGLSWKSPKTAPEKENTKHFLNHKQQNSTMVESAAQTAVKRPIVPVTAPIAPIAAGRSAPKMFHYFDCVLRKVQQRFNATFGRQKVTNVDTRCRVILAIVGLQMLHQSILTANHPRDVRVEIARFVRCSRTLHRIFDQMVV